MTDIFDLDSDGAAALDDEARRNPLRAEDLPVPAWAGSGEALKGLLRPSASAGRALMMAGAPVAMAIDRAAEFGDLIGGRTAQREALGLAPDRLGAADWYFRNVVDDTGGNAVDAWTANPEAMGSAAKALNVGSTVIGSLPQMIATPELFLAQSGLDPATELVRQGVDTKTALAVGGANLAANAIGMKIPAAWGNTLTQRLLTGVGSNLGIGVAADAASNAALASGGYTEQAAGYDAKDPYARALDALMGAAFGWKANIDAPRLPAAERDAVLAVKNNDHLHRQTLPGEPASASAARAHAGSVSSAIDQLLRGEPVNVADAVRAEDFVPRPQPARPAPGAAPVAANYDAFLVALESGGRADAKASTSSATGLHQFTKGTWLRTVRNAAPAWARGMDDAQLLTQRTNPARSAEMERALRAENSAALVRAGQKVDGFNLYAAHHFGERGGVKFAQADGSTPMSQILTADQLKANAYLRGLTKDEAIANWTARAKKAGVDMPAGRVPFEDPDVAPQRQFAQAMRAVDAPEDVIRQFMPQAPRDSVTGFFDGRVDQVKSGMVERAVRHVTETGEPGHFVSADLFNLGGLNQHLGNQAEAANVHYGAMARILERELRATGADVVPMRTGGDEFGAVVVNAAGPKIAEAIERANAKVARYAREQGLADIPHPKRSGEKGVGLHIGSAEIRPGQSVRAILDRADDGVNLSKLKASENVARRTPGTAGSEPPEGRPGGAEARDGAPDSGVRPAETTGEAGTRMGAGDGGRPPQGDRSAVSAPESPIQAAAQLAAQSPDTLAIVGFDPDGAPIYRPVSEALAEIQAEQARAAADAEAYPAAVSCFLRRGGNAP